MPEANALRSRLTPKRWLEPQIGVGSSDFTDKYT
jgi:hypothetical protein